MASEFEAGTRLLETQRPQPTGRDGTTYEEPASARRLPRPTGA